MVVFNILLFLVALSILVFVHELGHFVFAKLFGVYCHEFSLGMGPAIFKKKFKKDKETTYSLRAFPIGGYVAMAGEEVKEDESIPYNRTINGIKAWKRAIIVVAGATVNFIFGFILIVVVAFSGKTVLKQEAIVEVAVDSPVYNEGLRTNDLITKIIITGDSSACSLGCEINSSKELLNILLEPTLEEEQSQDITIFYVRGEAINSITITRVYDETAHNKQSLIGISGIYYRPGFFEGIKLSFQDFGFIIKSMFKAIGGMFSKEGFSQLGGPVQIYVVSAEQASRGFASYVWFVAILSINLGFFNLLPIPALDGSRFIISIAEMITGKKFNPKIENYINFVGLILLLSLIVAVTIKDVVGLF